jgi:hypothetical protein
MADLRAGFRFVRNPFNSRSARRVSLAPEDVDCVVFWTRDPRHLVDALPELESRGLRFYVQMTLTGYPEALEPGVPRRGAALEAAARLSDSIGADRLLWRYDPIFVAEGLSPDRHLASFEGLCAELEGKTRRITLSLIDEYAGTSARLLRAGYPGAVFGSPRRVGKARSSGPSDHMDPTRAACPPEPYPGLLRDLAAVARSRGIEPVACSEPYDLSAYGIGRAACVDAALIGKLFGLSLPASKDKGQRPACLCAQSVDIGDYGSCPAGCVYCYATRGAIKTA